MAKMTRAEIRNKARKQLGETTSSFWSDTELNLWINDAVDDIAFRTRCLRTKSTMTAVVDTMEYTLSTYFPTARKFTEVYYKVSGDTWRKLEETDRKELDLENDGWLSASSGAPYKFAYDHEQDWFLIWPPPDSDNVGGAYVKAYYTFKPTDMTADTDYPQIPDVLHELIVEAVKIVGFESRGLGDRANNSRSIFNSGLKDYMINSDQEEDVIQMRNYKCR